MAKYLLLKHYRGAPARGQRRADGPVDAGGGLGRTCSSCRTSPLGSRAPGEFVDSQALSPGGHVRPLRRRGAAAGHRRPVRRDQGPDRRLDGDRRRDLRAGGTSWRASCPRLPGAGGKPIHEWLEVRPFLAAPPTITE